MGILLHPGFHYHPHPAPAEVWLAFICLIVLVGVGFYQTRGDVRRKK